MCGIWSFIELTKNSNNDFYKNLYNDFMSIKNRGPDMSSYSIINNLHIGFHRLAIMDTSFNANQPYFIENDNSTIIFVCNGEIYNFKELNEKYSLSINNNSDCMTIPQLYIKLGFDEFIKLFEREIKGEFAFLLFEFDKNHNMKQIIVGRDMVGVRPLYYHKPNLLTTNLIFSSEIKGMNSFQDDIQEFEPGTICVIRINDNKPSAIYTSFKHIYNTTPVENTEEKLLTVIREAVINSVRRRLLSDRPIAFLLSGGVDSSLVAAISTVLLGHSINTYCCGMSEGTDMIYARMVAEHIKSNHTEVYFTESEGLDAIEDVVRTTETWDTTSIRASVGQYIVCKHIGTKTSAKVVMVGEGPDEVCSSYLFNFYAPNGDELHEAAKEYVSKIHMFDGRRADRCISRWGLEGRIALLDPEFIEAYWQLPGEMRHPKYKGIEKWWLRQAFNDMNLLPNEVLWRKKEAFSDGVSGKKKSWFQIIQDYVKEKMGDKIIKLPTMEAQYYQDLFIKYYGENRLSIIPHYWQPKWIQNGNTYIDPSARVLPVYN
jgi:asparagine synthase (glutamine-hydrolysing)